MGKNLSIKVHIILIPNFFLKLQQPFTLIVSDMNDSPQRVAKELLRVVDLLAPEGFVIATMKLRLTTNSPMATLHYKQMCETLEPHFKDFKLKWLCTNSMAERTIIIQKKSN